MIQFFQNLLCNLDNADVYHVPLERLDFLVYPELQKAHAYLCWLQIAVQNLSPDMIRYLQKKHRLLKRCFYKLNLNLNQKPQLILLSIDQPCIRNKVGPGGGYRI